MKKYFIKDEDGKEYKVEEVEEVKEHDEEPAPEEEAMELTRDEIAALKSLAAVADKLVAMAGEVHDEDGDDDDKDVDDEIEEVVEKDKDEEIVDTEECEDEDEEEKKDAKKAKDSKSSFGKITTKKVEDTYDSVQDEVSDAWAKRYNGGKN